MSTHWDLRCVDCDSWLGFHKNHGDEECVVMLGLKTQLAAAGRLLLAMKAQCWGFDSWQFGVSHGSYEGSTVDVEWFTKHESHKLEVRNEYGKLLGSCAKDVRCACCQSRVGRCDREPEHEGECSKATKT